MGNYQKPIQSGMVINEGDPMLRTIEALKESRWVFVSFLGNPCAIVTRGDLQRAPMRMWLFGFISLLEMQMLRRIRNTHPGEEWHSLISEGRIEKAREVLLQRLKHDESIDLAECLQISDKKTILGKSNELRNGLGFPTQKAWSNFMNRVERLRNLLAHSSGIPSGTWPENANVIAQIETCLKYLEQNDSE